MSNPSITAWTDGPKIFRTRQRSRAHGRIGLNACALLAEKLDDGPCNVYNSDVAARISSTRYTYPDATVTCDECDQATTDEREIQSPRVIIEVLSDTTEAYDRGEKFALYRDCPTLQEYVLVATKYQVVEVYRRTSKGWKEYDVYGPYDEIELTSIGVNIPVAALYKRTTVQETWNAPQGEV